MIDSIQQFNSVPEILQALLKSRKPKAMSIRQLSRQLGYSSDRTVGMVLQGHREMAPDMLKRLSDFAQLSPRDKDYLVLLTEKQKKQRLGLPTADVDRLLEEQKQKASKTRKVPAHDLSEITPWFSYVLLEVLSLSGKPLDAAAFKEYLRGDVSVADIEKTLQAMAALNFIKTTEQGYYRALADNEYIETPPDMPSLTVRAIHRNQLARAASTLEEQAVSEREFIAKTLTISSERIPALKKKIREMMEELAGQFMVSDSEDAVVTQLNFQFYQQSRGRKK